VTLLSSTEPLLSTSSPSSRQSPYVLGLTLTAAISGFLFGFDTAVINGALVFLRQQFSLNDFQTEFAASTLLVGCLLGALLTGPCSDRLGRRPSLIAVAILFTLSAIGAALSPSLAWFAITRFMGGVAIGLASALTPVYISEIAPPKIRGRLVSMNQLAIVIGILAAYLANWRLSSLGTSSWRWMFLVAAIPSVFFFLGLLRVPESPRWLIARSRKSEGTAVLARIMGQAGAEAAAAEIEIALAEEAHTAHELTLPGMRKRLAVAVVLAILQQISGINTVLYYGSILMTEQVHSKSLSSAIAANVVVGVVNLLFTLIAIMFIDRWGRRGLLLTASGGMALALGALVLSLRLAPQYPLIAFASVLLYVAFFAVGLGPGVWVYAAEIFPTRVRGQAMSIAVASLWTACLAVTFTFLTLVHVAGISGAFLVYAIISFITFLFIWRWVPETRGRSLEEIQHFWGE
jgi:SP family arabinose:H+ symporter-like MFS transporter